MPDPVFHDVHVGGTSSGDSPAEELDGSFTAPLTDEGAAALAAMGATTTDNKGGVTASPGWKVVYASGSAGSQPHYVVTPPPVTYSEYEFEPEDPITPRKAPARTPTDSPSTSLSPTAPDSTRPQTASPEQEPPAPAPAPPAGGDPHLDPGPPQDDTTPELPLPGPTVVNPDSPPWPVFPPERPHPTHPDDTGGGWDVSQRPWDGQAVVERSTRPLTFKFWGAARPQVPSPRPSLAPKPPPQFTGPASWQDLLDPEEMDRRLFWIGRSGAKGSLDGPNGKDSNFGRNLLSFTKRTSYGVRVSGSTDVLAKGATTGVPPNFLTPLFRTPQEAADEMSRLLKLGAGGIRDEFALLSEWNSITSVGIVEVPAGTPVLTAEIKEQTESGIYGKIRGPWSGGGRQTIVLHGSQGRVIGVEVDDEMNVTVQTQTNSDGTIGPKTGSGQGVRVPDITLEDHFIRHGLPKLRKIGAVAPGVAREAVRIGARAGVNLAGSYALGWLMSQSQNVVERRGVERHTNKVNEQIAELASEIREAIEEDPDKPIYYNAKFMHTWEVDRPTGVGGPRVLSYWDTTFHGGWLSREPQTSSKTQFHSLYGFLRFEDRLVSEPVLVYPGAADEQDE